VADDSPPKIVNLDGSPYEPPIQTEVVNDEIGLIALVSRILADKDNTTAVLCIIRCGDGMEYMDSTEMLKDTQKALAVAMMGMVQAGEEYLYFEEDDEDEADDND
jgi:hypothetical protein